MQGDIFANAIKISPNVKLLYKFLKTLNGYIHLYLLLHRQFADQHRPLDYVLSNNDADTDSHSAVREAEVPREESINCKHTVP